MRPLRDVSSSIGRTVSSLRRSAMAARRAARPSALDATLAALPSGLMGEALTEILSTRLRDAVRWWVATPQLPNTAGSKRGRLETDAAGPDPRGGDRQIGPYVAPPSPRSRLRQTSIGEPSAVLSDWGPTTSLQPGERLAVSSSSHPDRHHRSGGGGRAATARGRQVPSESESASGRAATSLVPLRGAVSRYWSALGDRRMDGETAGATVIERVDSPAESAVSPDHTVTPSRRIGVPPPARDGRQPPPSGPVRPASAERWWQSRVEALHASLAPPAERASGSAGDRADAIDEQPFADVLAEVLRDQAEQYGVPLT